VIDLRTVERIDPDDLAGPSFGPTFLRCATA
jgi:hypothetical protein